MSSDWVFFEHKRELRNEQVAKTKESSKFWEVSIFFFSLDCDRSDPSINDSKSYSILEQPTHRDESALNHQRWLHDDFATGSNTTSRRHYLLGRDKLKEVLIFMLR